MNRFFGPGTQEMYGFTPGMMWDPEEQAAQAAREGQAPPQPMMQKPQEQQQQQGGGMNPQQAYRMYEQFGPQAASPGASAAAPATTTAPVASAGAPSAAGAAPGAGGGGFGSGAMALAANPYAWMAAAIAAGAISLDHNDISSFDNQLKGQGMKDILHSPNVKNFAKDVNIPDGVMDAFKAGDAMGRLDFKDFYKYGSKPFKKIGSFLSDLF